MDLEIGLRLLAVLFLVLANGFFVAAEFSLVAIRRSRVEQLAHEGSSLALAVQRGVGHLDTYLAACQLGITMASIGLGWIGEPALAGLIEPAFSALPETWTWVSSHAAAVAIAFGIITALHIVLGELAPKSLALQRTEGTALAVALPLGIFLTVFRPAIALLNGAGNLVVRSVGLHPVAGEEQVHSVEELRYLVAASHEAGVLDAIESDIVHRAFSLAETQVHEVMVPRTEIAAIMADITVEEAMDQVVREEHSRLAVYDGSVDNIVGVVHLHDLLRSVRETARPSVPVRDIMREPLVLPETASVESVLLEMRRSRRQIVVLIDEHGGTAGLVTLHDLLEVIVGDISDELSAPHEDITVQPDGSAVIDGMVPIREINERFGLKLAMDEGYSTVGGLVMAQLGRIPQAGDTIFVEGYRFTVQAMDGLRVATVQLLRT